MTEPITVLVTGQLRTPDVMRESVRAFNGLRGSGHVDRVLVVTWREDAERETDLVHWLRGHDAIVTVLDEPPIRGIGNIWPQTLSLDVGLRGIPDDRRVLKTRADLSIDPRLIAHMAETPALLRLDHPSDAQPPAPFRHRVWVPWMEISKPFYLADECFLGAACDLRTLINYDESYSLLFSIGCGITHVRRFIDPFVRGSLHSSTSTHSEPVANHLPGLLGYLRSLTDMGHFSPNRWTLLEERLADDAYLRAIAEYFTIMATFFRVGAPDGSVRFRDWSSGTPQPIAGPIACSFTSANNGLGEGSEAGGHLFCHGEHWLHTVLTAEPDEDHAGDRIRAFSRRLLNRGLPSLPTPPMEDITLNDAERDRQNSEQANSAGTAKPGQPAAATGSFGA